MKTKVILILMGAGFAAVGLGCGDDTEEAVEEQKEAEENAANEGAGEGAEVCSGPNCGAAEGGEGTAGPEGGEGGAPAPVKLGLAVLNSDFTTTSVALADLEKRDVTADNVFHSGSAAAGLSAALSFDAAFPSNIMYGNAIAVIDRSNAVIDFLGAADGGFVRQFKVSKGGAPVNPQDIYFASGELAFVSRLDAAPNGSEGNDVAMVNPTTGEITGRVEIQGEVPAADAGNGALARPGQIIAAGASLFVTMGMFDVNFTGFEARIAELDAATGKLLGSHAIPGCKGGNGGVYDRTAGVLYVVCAGVFSDGENQIKASGIWQKDVQGGGGFERLVSAEDAAGQALGFQILEHGAKLYVTSFGTAEGDKFIAVDKAAGAAETVAQAGNPYEFQGMVLDAQGGALFLADASATDAQIRVFEVAADGGLKAAGGFKSAPDTKLPPRGLALYQKP